MSTTTSARLTPRPTAIGVVDHLVERDRQCGFVTVYDIGGAVTHQHDVDTGAVENAGKCIVVAGQHGDFLAACLHFGQARGCDTPHLGATFA